MTTSLKSAGRITGMFCSVVLLGGVCFAEPGVTFSLEAGPPGAAYPFPAAASRRLPRVTAVVAIVTGDAAQAPFNVLSPSTVANLGCVGATLLGML